MFRHLTAIALILAVASGCDNVEFGGASIEIVDPPTSSVEPAEEVVAAPEDTSNPNVHNPVLLAGVRDGDRATLTVVGEVHGPELQPFPHPDFEDDEARLDELTAVGTEWVLFSEGVRIGTLFADERVESTEYCGSPAGVSGRIELIPGAANAERLLALPAADATDRPFEPYREINHGYDQRVATLQIAQQIIPERGATWPNSVLDSRQHIQAFDLDGPDGPFIAATFMYRDQLAVGAPSNGGYSIFLIGEQGSTGHDRAFASYRAVDTDGKGAPRYFDHLDWDGNGSEEIVLDVFGADQRWFAGLAKIDGSWVRTFQDACGAPSGASG